MTTKQLLPERLLTTKEAAHVLGISERKLWELANRGEIPRVDMDPRCKRYDPSDLAAWIERKKTKAR